MYISFPAPLLAALLIFSVPHAPMADIDFMNAASRCNLAEIAAGKIAAKQGSNGAIRAFGDSMIADHSTAQSELTQIAHQEGLSLVQSADTDHVHANDRLAKLSGSAFDTCYINTQMRDHDAAVKLFQQEEGLGRDSLAKMYASKYLPKLQHHREMATAITSN